MESTHSMGTGRASVAASLVRAAVPKEIMSSWASTKVQGAAACCPLLTVLTLFFFFWIFLGDF